LNYQNWGGTLEQWTFDHLSTFVPAEVFQLNIIECARNVGEILEYLKEDEIMQLEYSFYI